MTGLDFLADGGADFEHAITVTGRHTVITLFDINCTAIRSQLISGYLILSRAAESFIEMKVLHANL